MIDLQSSMTQSEFGKLVGISQPAVSDLLRREILQYGQPVEIWLARYCAHLRKQAEARAATGDLDLAAERAALAREQRDRIAMQNAATRRELAPTATLELALATVGRKVAAVLESIPLNIQRRSKNLTADDIAIITSDINRACQIATTAQLADVDDGQVEDVDADAPGPEGEELLG